MDSGAIIENDGDSDSCANKSRDEFLNFNDPPKLTFSRLKIPRKSKNNEQVSLNVSPLNNISPIVPPFPGIENSIKNINDPVRKVVIDDITGKFKATPKLVSRDRFIHLPKQ